MLAAAVQLPAAVVTDAQSGDTDRAPSPSELALEASAGTANVRTAQTAHATDPMRTTKPLSSPL
jgi:hypothetical protein